jgi:GAF domain-containing protein
MNAVTYGAAGPERDRRVSCRWRLTAVDGTLDRIAAAAAIALNVPLVAITFLDQDRQVCIGSHGFVREDRTLFSGFCLEVAVANRPIVIQDVRGRASSTGRRTWGLDLVAYAGVPLVLLNGERSGAIGACTTARRAWQDRDLAILRALGDAATVVLDLELRLSRATVAFARLEAGVDE